MHQPTTRLSRIAFLAIALATLTLPCLDLSAQTNLGAAIRGQETADQFASPLLSETPQGAVFSGFDRHSAFAPPSPGDNDLGDQLIFKETPKQRPFRASAETFVLWTDNVANASRGELSDAFWGTRLAAGWQPRLGQRWFADLDVSQQIFRYDRFDVLDFELFDTSASLIHILPLAGDILLVAGPRYQRMTRDNFSDELFNNVSIRASAQKLFLINYRNSVHAGITGEWDVHNDFDVLMRYQYTGALTWKYKIMRDLTFAASYRFTWMDYANFPREDALSIVGASLTWSPASWIDIYATANWSHNDSNLDFFDYTTSTLGGGLAATIRF